MLEADVELEESSKLPPVFSGEHRGYPDTPLGARIVDGTGGRSLFDSTARVGFEKWAQARTALELQ